MSATVNHAEEECLSNMLSQLDSSFGNRKGLRKLVDEAVSVLSNLKNGLAREMAEEVAQLVLKPGSEEAIKQLLKQNFPSGVTIGNVEEMLKLVYVGTDKKNLKKAINFVQMFDSSHQAGAYKALYEDIKFKKHTNEPEMLLLQKKIRLLKSVVLIETKKQVDEDCRKIIGRIVKGIEEKDYSISIYVADELDYALLDENMATIVQEFFTGSLENTPLLIQYSQGLPHISNQCFLIDALLKELEKRQLLMDSMQAMQLWAHAKWTKEENLNWPNVAARRSCSPMLLKNCL
jgi:hypothetical protein